MENSLCTVVAICNESDYESIHYEEHTEPILINDFIPNNMIRTESVGIIINIKDKTFVITCYHSIKNYIDIGIYYSDYINNSLTPVAILEECDIVLLEYTGDVSLRSITIDNFNPQINEELKYNVIIPSINEENLNLDLDFKNISFESPSLFLLSDIIYMYFEKHEFIFKGCSGSPVLDSRGSIVSMIVSQDNDGIKAIHSSFILRLLREYSGICGLAISYDLCQIGDIYGLKLNNTHEVNYNNNPYATEKYRYKNIKVDDIIIEINNQKLDRQGYIYDEICQKSIPFSTYIGLNFVSTDLIPLKLLRNRGEYKQLNLNIVARPYNTMLTLPIYTKKFMIYGDLVYCELSEEILLYLLRKECEIPEVFLNSLISNPYINDYDKRIVIILGSVNNDNPNKLSIVNKINNKNINNLDHMNELLVK